MAQIQKNLGKLHPHIEGDKDYGFKYASFITSNTVFAASAGLSGAAVAGQLRYDTSEATYKYWNGSAEVALAAASALGVGLDGAYDQGKTITVDAATITLTGSNADVLTITNSANAECINITKTGAGAGYPVQIQNSGTGEDIYGTSGTWKVSKAGAATFTTIAGTDLTFTGTQTITTDDTSGVAINIEADSLTTGTAIEVDSNTGANVTLLDLQNAGTSCFIVSGTGILTLAGVAKDADAIAITAGDITLTAGDIDMSSGQFTLVSDQAGDGMTVTDTTGAGNYDLVYFNGTTSTGSGSILKIDQGASIRTGHMVDLNMGTTSVGMSAIDISCTGGTRTKPIIAIDSDGTASDFITCVDSVIFTGNMISLTQDTGAATGNFIYINNDSGTSMEAINIDDEANVADIILVDSAANIGAGKAQLHLIQSAGTPNATSNGLLIDWTAATNSTAYLAKIDANGKTFGALTIDSDNTAYPTVLINCGGALTDGLGVLNLTNDGNLAAGGNLLNVTMGGTPADETACAIEIVAAKDCQALAIATSAATASGIVFTGSGATADNTAVFEVNWGSSTPANAGSNLVRIDGTDATMTNKPVLCEILDNSTSVGLSVSTASIEDMVTFIGTGATGSAKAVVDITSTAVMNAGGNLLRLDVTGADTTAVPNVLEIVGTGETARGIYVDTDGTSKGAALFHSGGALTNGVGVVMITNDGALAAGGSMLQLTMGGTPADETVVGLEVLAAKNCLAATFAGSPTTGNMIEMSSNAVTAAGMATLAITGTGTIADGSYYMDITTGANGASSTASYLLHLDAAHTNIEALHVDAGKVLIDETLTVTAGAEITADAGIGNWTVDAATATSDGTGTGVIPDNVNCVQVTSTDTDHWLTLPTPTPGKEVWIIAHATSACELRSSAADTVYINNVVGAGCELTITADTTYHALCINATNWIVEKYDNVGAPTGGGTPN